MELWSPLPLYEGVFYRRSLNATGSSVSGSAKLSVDPDSSNQSYTYNNHVLQGCNLWYNPRDLKPRDIGRYRLVLVEGTHKGRMRGLQLSLDSELKSYTINNNSSLILSSIEGRKYCIEVTGISHASQLEERWQIITTSEETQLSWMELLKKARSFADIAEASGEAEKLRELTKRMKEGLVVRKRISSFKLYNNTIVGFRAVRWIMQDKSCTLPQALAIGNRMLNLGLIYHVAFEHLFYSKSLLYQFAREFDPITPTNQANNELDADDLTAENHSLLSSFHVLQRECLRHNSLLIDLQTHATTLQQSFITLRSTSQTLQSYQRFVKLIMLVLIILISFIFVHVDFIIFSLPFCAIVLIALTCVLTIILTPIYYSQIQPNESESMKAAVSKMQRLLSDALKQSQEVDQTLHHQRSGIKNKNKPMIAVMPTINESIADNDSSNDSGDEDNENDNDGGSENSDKEDDVESIDSSNNNSINGNLDASSDVDNINNNTDNAQLSPTTSTKDETSTKQHSSSKAKQVLLKYTNPEQEWPNYPLLIRRSSDMLAKHLTTAEREVLLEPLRLHRKELSVVDFENEYFIGKAYLIFNNLPDTNQDLFRGKKRQFQTIIQGKFKQSIPFTNLYIGQAYNEQPPQPPSSWLLNGIVKLIPSAQMRLIGNRPYLLSPLMATMQHIVISNAGEEPDIMNLDLEDDVTLLNDEYLLSCNNNSIKRKKYFSRRRNLAMYATDLNVVYTFDFFAKQVNFNTFQLEVGIFKHDLIKALGWLPLQIMCVVYDPMEEKKRSSFTAAATASLSPFEKEVKKDKEWSFLYNFEVWHQRSLATVATSSTVGGRGGPLTPPIVRASSSFLLGRVPEEKEWMAAFGSDVNSKEEDSGKLSSPRKGLGSLLLFPMDSSINDKDVVSNSGPLAPNPQQQQVSAVASSTGGNMDGNSNKLRSWLTRRGSKG